MTCSTTPWRSRPSIRTETAELVFDSEVTLEHIEAPHPDYALAEDAQTFPFAYSREERLDLVRALERQHPAGEVDRWAAGFLPKDGRIGTMALLRKITLGIREQLTYSRRYERGVQTPAETLAKASGTCRDYAFLMMEGVRSLGLAARFVSGYIFVPNSRGWSGQRGWIDACLAAGLPAGCRLGRFRSDQQHHRQPEPDPRGGRMGSRTGFAFMGNLYRAGIVLPGNGSQRSVMDEAGP